MKEIKAERKCPICKSCEVVFYPNINCEWEGNTEYQFYCGDCCYTFDDPLNKKELKKFALSKTGEVKE